MHNVLNFVLTFVLYDVYTTAGMMPVLLVL